MNGVMCFGTWIAVRGKGFSGIAMRMRNRRRRRRRRWHTKGRQSMAECVLPVQGGEQAAIEHRTVEKVLLGNILRVTELYGLNLTGLSEPGRQFGIDTRPIGGNIQRLIARNNLVAKVRIEVNTVAVH